MRSPGMTPHLDRKTLGWDAPARGFLVLSALLLASALAWASRGHPEAGRELPSFSVDVNTVPVEVLGALPGLGPVLSGRIAVARDSSPFRSFVDLDRRVKGIGPSKVAALRPYLRFEVNSDPQP